MGKVIRVTPEELGAAASSLSDLAERYTDEYNKLFRNASTMGTAWEGDDNQAFVTQINGLVEDLDAMATRLRNASEMLTIQQNNYKNRQDDNIAQIKRLSN